MPRPIESERPDAPDARTPPALFGPVPARSRRLADDVYGQILDRIMDGQLRQGDRLPPETALSAHFGVSRPIVREALLRLRADGLLLSRQGAGTFVLARPAARLRSLAAPDRVAGFLRCIEVRLPLEAAAAGYAAERRTAEQLAAIAEAARVFAAHVFATGPRDAAALPSADLAFHASIARATGNAAFPATLAALHEELAGFMGLALGLTRAGSARRSQTVIEEHEAVLEAIRARAPAAARAAMARHIERARGRIVDRSRDP